MKRKNSLRKKENKYRKYEVQMKKLAWRFSKSYNQEFEDLFSECNIVYCLARKNYKIGMGCSFSTYLYKCCVNQLINYLKKIQKQKELIEINTKKAFYFGMVDAHQEKRAIFLSLFLYTNDTVVRYITQIVLGRSQQDVGFPKQQWLIPTLSKRGISAKKAKEGIKRYQQLIATF